jgi:hypothetical protein
MPPGGTKDEIPDTRKKPQQTLRAATEISKPPLKENKKIYISKVQNP